MMESKKVSPWHKQDERSEGKPGPKPDEESRTIPVSFKVSKKELEKINHLTKLYSKEGRSDFIRMRVLGYEKTVGHQRAAKKREVTL
jgi:hypothetical protein